MASYVRLCVCVCVSRYNCFDWSEAIFLHMDTSLFKDLNRRGLLEKTEVWIYPHSVQLVSNYLIFMKNLRINLEISFTWIVSIIAHMNGTLLFSVDSIIDFYVYFLSYCRLFSIRDIVHHTHTLNRVLQHTPHYPSLGEALEAFKAKQNNPL